MFKSRPKGLMPNQDEFMQNNYTKATKTGTQTQYILAVRQHNYTTSSFQKQYRTLITV